MLGYFTSQEEPRWTRWLLLLFIPLLLLYYVAAKGNAETKNHDVYANDQKVYLNTASKIAHDPTGYFTPRQRTPGYPYFLSLFYSEQFDVPEETKPPFAPAWFERGKRVNLFLSMFLLAGLFLFCLTLLPIVESGILTVASGLLLFTFKAGYVQPELSYWVLNTILYVLMGKMLLSPSWKLAIGCGLLSALTYFVKAGTQPLLFLFLVTWLLKVSWDTFSYRRRKRRGTLDAGEAAPRVGVLAAQGALVIAIFLAVLTPYFIGTNKKFGKPFYSVYTEFMMWLPLDDDGGESFLVDKDYMWAFYYAGARSKPITVDDFNASLERTVRARIKKEAKGKLTDDELGARVSEVFKPLKELPSASNYFASYPPSHGVERVKNGLVMVQKRMKKYYKRASGMLKFVLVLALYGVALRLSLWLWNCTRTGRSYVCDAFSPPGRLQRLLARSPYLVFYVLGFFLGYLVLYAWYDALGIGPRLMLSLYVPLFLTGMLVLDFIHRGLAYNIPQRLGGRQVYVGKVANLVLLGALVYLSFRLMGGELYEHMNTGG